MTTPLATPSDVADLWRPLTDAEKPRIASLIAKASSKLRQACPFDIDARIALFTTTPGDPTALDPMLVADRVATIVKRFLVNPDGVASNHEGVGPFSRAAIFVNRYDKTGADVRGELRITEEDIDELRPAVPAQIPFSIEVGVPDPRVLIPRGGLPFGGYPGSQLGPIIVPDIAPDTGTE